MCGRMHAGDEPARVITHTSDHLTRMTHTTVMLTGLFSPPPVKFVGAMRLKHSTQPLPTLNVFPPFLDPIH